MVTDDVSVSALQTDWYQLAMAHAYFELGMHDIAVFELFVRRLPSTRRFLIAAGLAQVVGYLEGLRFTAGEVEFLAASGSFPDAFLEYLAGMRFTGSLHAMPEGSVCFADEPILRITAPLPQAQLVESRILNLVHFETLIASKAARYVQAAGEHRLIDFGMRRAHGAEAGLLAARAAYLAGFSATATVAAGRQFGVPLAGTMAHSFIEAHDQEEVAIRNFLRVRPGDTTVLIDTYDTYRAARRVASLHQEWQADHRGGRLAGVRIDSGDLVAQALEVRQIFDTAGCRDLRITLSGGLDEHDIERILAAGTPVDSFGVGTQLDASADTPTLDMVYKLQQFAGRPRRKRSPGKPTWPGTKQVWRERNSSGAAIGDLVALDDEPAGGTPMLVEIMRNGRRVGDLPELTLIRQHCALECAGLPPDLRSLAPVSATERGYPVQVSDRIRTLADQLDARGE
jgi:nicotinate phosphoribosyltransferase